MAAVEDHSSTAVVLSAAQGLDNLACRNFPAYSSLCVHAAGGAGSEELTTEPRSRGSQAGDVLVEGQEDSATNAELSEGCQKQFPWPPPGFVGITASPEPPPSFTDTERLAFQALASAFDKCAGKCLLGPEAAQQCILLELQARTGIQAIAVPSDVLQWMATVCAMCAQPLTATQPSPSTRSITIKECVRYCSRACETHAPNIEVVINIYGDAPLSVWDKSGARQAAHGGRPAPAPRADAAEPNIAAGAGQAHDGTITAARAGPVPDTRAAAATTNPQSPTRHRRMATFSDADSLTSTLSVTPSPSASQAPHGTHPRQTSTWGPYPGPSPSPSLSAAIRTPSAESPTRSRPTPRPVAAAPVGAAAAAASINDGSTSAAAAAALREDTYTAAAAAAVEDEYAAAAAALLAALPSGRGPLLTMSGVGIGGLGRTLSPTPHSPNPQSPNYQALAAQLRLLGRQRSALQSPRSPVLGATQIISPRGSGSADGVPSLAASSPEPQALSPIGSGYAPAATLSPRSSGHSLSGMLIGLPDPRDPTVVSPRTVEAARNSAQPQSPVSPRELLSSVVDRLRTPRSEAAPESAPRIIGLPQGSPPGAGQTIAAAQARLAGRGRRLAGSPVAAETPLSPPPAAAVSAVGVAVVLPTSPPTSPREATPAASPKANPRTPTRQATPAASPQAGPGTFRPMHTASPRSRWGELSITGRDDDPAWVGCLKSLKWASKAYPYIAKQALLKAFAGIEGVREGAVVSVVQSFENVSSGAVSAWDGLAATARDALLCVTLCAQPMRADEFPNGEGQEGEFVVPR